jgi:PAS domain S-box-containing protein
MHALSSLRVRLLLVLLLGVFPAFGLACYLGVEHRRQAMAKAHADAIQLARTAAATPERLIEAERQLLATLAALPDVRGGDAAACQARFADLLNQYRRYANLAVTTPDGYTTCSALPFTPPVRTTHRAWYRRVLASRAFVVGDYQVGTITGKATINMALPVLGEANQILAILTAALDVGWLNQLLAEAHLPEAATLSIIDRSGTMVARYPDSERWVGRSVMDTPIVQTVVAQGAGAADLPGLDGVTRLFAFKPLVGSGQDAYLYMFVGVSTAAVFAEADRLLLHIFVVLGVAALVGMAAAWAGADWLVLRPIQRLVRATGRVAAGDLGARAGLSYDRGELGQLARAFDAMAQTLEARQAEATQAIDALRASEALYRSMFADNPLPMWVYDLETLAFLDVNDAAVTHYGYTRDEFLAMTILEIRPPEAIPLLLDRMERARATSVYRPGFSRHRTKDGRVIEAEVSSHAVHVGERPARLVLAHDVTERQRVEAEITRLNAELELRVVERTAQLEAANRELETFSYSVSHDLRAPLRGIDGFSQVLLEDHGQNLDAEGQDCLRRIRGATQRMADLIEALLALARVTRVALVWDPVNLTRMAHAIAADLRGQEPARRVTFTIGEGLMANGDARLLRVVLENLLGNAWKFSAKQPEAYIEVGSLPQPDGTLAFFVRDNGAGFDMTYANRLFGAFQRLHRSQEFPGMGIGLATVQRIIHRHGGRVWAEGAIGQGATFYFTVGQRAADM